MATRMQQRRGTQAQWTNANPVLNAGEIGFEIDNNRFKIGDGINHWDDLPYFSDNQSLTDLIDGAPALLDTLNELAAAIGDDPDFFTTVADNLSDHTSATTNVHGIADTADLATQEFVTSAVAGATVDQSALAGDGISWNDSTDQYDVDATIARLNSPTFTGTVSGITKSMVGLGNVDNTSDANKPISTAAQTAIDLKANIDSPTFTGTVAGVTKAMVGLGNADNTSDANKPISTAAQTALDLKAPKHNPALTGTATTENLTVNGDFTVNGTNFSASATSITIEDNLVQLAHQNPANTVDLGLVVAYNDGVSGKHSGLVRDVSENTWKLFKNVTTEPSTTVDFTQGSLDDLQVASFQASSAVIGGVSNTELQYLNGVTSAIQDQLDDKLETSTAASTYAPIESPTFTGTVAGITKAMVGLSNVDNTADADKDISDLTQAALDLKAPINNPTFTGLVSGVTKGMVGLGNVDNTSDANKPVSDATQTALNLKANLAGPTFTGTVVLPTSTSIGEVSATELGYVNGVTSPIQNQLDLKIATTTVESTYAPLANPTFTGTVSGITKSMVGLANADNTSDADKPISDDTQAALDLKAPLANPTFTGTVSGITKSMVGLGSVDNTSDANKPVSTATQTALDLKAPLANPTFTGTVTLPTGTVTAGMILDGTIVNADINASAAIALSKLATDPLARANHTGTQTASTISDFNEAAQDAVGTILGSGLTYTDASNTITVDSSVVQLRVTGVSDTEIGYLDGVTSSVQTQLAARLPLAGGTMTGALTLSGAPTQDLHAATKAYVDNVSAGLNFHQPVRVATTANITLSGTQTIDGVSVIAGDRVLVKDQTDQKTNGIYVVGAGPWSRAADADNTPDGELKGGDFTLVLEGTVNSGFGYVCSNTSAVTIGTTNVTYAPFNAAQAVTAGTGLTETTPGTIAIATGGVTSAMIADATIVDADISSSAAIAQSKIDGLSASFASKANLASPTFTGTVTIPNGAALGTPASATLTNATGLPVATGISGLGTGIATALAVNAGSSGAPVINGGALGTPSGGTLTNATGLPVSTGISGLGTGVATFLATPSSANFASMISDEIGTGNVVLSEVATNAQTASYTLVAADKAKMVEMNVSTANNLTVPTNASVPFPVGTKIDILQVGAGQTTIVAASGVTVNATPGLKIRAQWGSATLIKRAENTWVLVGDISA